jgi:hypothetical protein
LSNREILLGDNPFFGIDHLSQERARERLKILTGFEKIIEIMQYVSELGVNGFVVSTHLDLRPLIQHIKKNTSLLEKMEFYPILPYAQGYVAKVTEKGTAGAINDILSNISAKNKLKILYKGSLGLIKRDIEKLIESFIDVELDSLKDTKINTIFLHDVITDLALGLGLQNVLNTYIEYVKDHYKIKVGLVTKNFPLLVNKLTEWDMKISTIMTSFNPIGYQMNPSKSECEKSLKQFHNVIAMNTMAGGFVSPSQAANYISGLDLDAVVGMSTQKHALETITAFRKK